LLHVDLALVLPSLLRLLLLLVLVLPVVHDLRDRRVGLGGDLDEVEILAVGVVAGLVGGLDSELAPVVVDQPHIGDADRVVDARGVTVRRADVLDRPASGPQRRITKLGLLLLISISCAMEFHVQWKSRCMQRPVPTLSCDSVEPRAGAASRDVAREVRNGSAPAFQASSVASLAAKSASDSWLCPPPRSLIARLASPSRSPPPTPNGLLSRAASRIRFPRVSLGSPPPTRHAPSLGPPAHAHPATPRPPA